MTYIIPISDEQRESLIASCQANMEIFTDPIVRGEIEELMLVLMAGRSPAQLARLERAKGLS